VGIMDGQSAEAHEHDEAASAVVSPGQWSVAQLVAHVAPSLSDAELRILVHLAAFAEASGDNTFPISSRELSRLTGQSRSTIRLATTSMCARQVIIVDRAGTTKASTRWRIAALELKPIGGPPVALPRPLDPNLGFFESVAMCARRTEG
jgi:hypothetical protein